MSASQDSTHARRTILRFDLESICMDDRPNAYKKPQLVLKPQLQLAPRRPYTGSRPRMPLWRHFLMVYVKDKVDELVKLDLAEFRPSSAGLEADPVRRHRVTCSLSQCSLMLCYPKGTENVSSTLRITLREASDLERVIREFHALDIEIEYEKDGQDGSITTGPVAFGAWTPPGQNTPSLYRPPSNPPQLNSASSLTATSSSQGTSSSYLERYPHSVLLHRPPSQPLGQPADFSAGIRPWSPAFVPSRPATTLGVPGILGEGIYKVSKIGSVSSARPRVRRTSASLEHQGTRLYTVSKHFNKTASTGDALHSSRARYLGRALSSSVPGVDSAPFPVRSSNFGTNGEKLGGDRAQTPLSVTSNAPGDVQPTQERPSLRRFHTTDDTSEPNLTDGLSDLNHDSAPAAGSEKRGGFSFSQPEMGSGSFDGALFGSSSPTLLEHPVNREIEDNVLLRISQIQHQGLCEASRLWEDYMKRGEIALASTESSRDVSDALSRYEREFTQRWEEIVVAAVQKMREVRVGGYVF